MRTGKVYYSKGVSHCPLHFGKDVKAGRGVKKLYSRKKRKSLDGGLMARDSCRWGGHGIYTIG